MNPTISVIMPNYNMVQYFPEALASICSQTFADFEVVFIDDGSQDESLLTIESFSKIDPRIRVLRNSKNIGAVSTVNRGIQEARGQYIHLLAADDKILSNNFFEQMIGLLEKNPSFSMCTSDHAMFLDGESKIHSWPVFPHLNAMTCIQPKEFMEMCRKDIIKYWLFAMGTIFRRELFLQNGFFSTDFPVLSDWYFVHLCALKEGCIYLPGFYVAWRSRGKNNLYHYMKKNEVLKLFLHIAKVKENRRLFNKSTLLGNYVKQSLSQIALRPYLWDFVFPFVKRKTKNSWKKIKKQFNAAWIRD